MATDGSLRSLRAYHCYCELSLIAERLRSAHIQPTVRIMASEGAYRKEAIEEFFIKFSRARLLLGVAPELTFRQWAETVLETLESLYVPDQKPPTYRDLAASLGINPATFYARLSAHPRLKKKLDKKMERCGHRVFIDRVLSGRRQ